MANHRAARMGAGAPGGVGGASSTPSYGYSAPAPLGLICLNVIPSYQTCHRRPPLIWRVLDSQCCGCLLNNSAFGDRCMQNMPIFTEVARVNEVLLFSSQFLLVNLLQRLLCTGHQFLNLRE